MLGRIRILLAESVFASVLAMISEKIRLSQTEIDSPVTPDYFLYGESLLALVAVTGIGDRMIIAFIHKKTSVSIYADIAK
jgi:hypothetical protein